jgi:hypothetical protein
MAQYTEWTISVGTKRELYPAQEEEEEKEEEEVAFPRRSCGG